MDSYKYFVYFLSFNWYIIAESLGMTNVTYAKISSLRSKGLFMKIIAMDKQRSGACIATCILNPGCIFLNVVSNQTKSTWNCTYFEQNVPAECWPKKRFITSTLKILKDKQIDENLPEESSVMNSCDDYASHGETENGLYCVVIKGIVTSVYCEFNSDGAWTVLQNRYDGSVDFYRDWNDYKKGFGDIGGEFWLGNDIIHELTKDDDKSVRFVLGDRDQTRYAYYDEFKIENENQQYTLRISGYSGNAGDSILLYSANRKFSTKDRDNDGNPNICSELFKTAWWMGNPCFTSSLNGQYHRGSGLPFANGIIWESYKGWSYSLYTSKVMIKSKNG